MKALLIEWNQSTGKRAGNINPKKDHQLLCHGWQNMEVNPVIELRTVEDDRDMSQYEGVPGITILNGKDAINAAIDANFTSKILIEDELLYKEHFKQEVGNNKIIITDLPDNRTKRLKELKDKYGIKGIKEIEPMKV